jgi:anti-anti-sigma factor
MELAESVQHDILIITPSGRLDSLSAPAFEAQLLEKLTQHQRLVLDLSQLDYISSAGLRVLLLVAKRIKQIDGLFVLSGPRPQLREVFEISGFMTILDIRPSMEEALAVARP